MRLNKLNKKDIKELLERTLSSGVSILVSTLIWYGFEKAYRMKKGHDFSWDPYSSKTNPTELILWRAAIGAIIGTTTTFIRPLVSREMVKLLDR